MRETIKPLGPLDHTSRGFELIEFKDRYGEKCTLQMSSLADYEQPGTSAVWLGPDQVKVHLGEQLLPHMHLDREQVKALIAHLSAWLDNGSFQITTQ